MLDQARARGFRPRTVGADKQYDTADFVADMRRRKITPDVTQNTANRASAIDGRTTSWYGYAVSQRIRTRVEDTRRPPSKSTSSAAC